MDGCIYQIEVYNRYSHVDPYSITISREPPKSFPSKRLPRTLSFLQLPTPLDPDGPIYSESYSSSPSPSSIASLSYTKAHTVSLSDHDALHVLRATYSIGRETISGTHCSGRTRICRRFLETLTISSSSWHSFRWAITIPCPSGIVPSEPEGFFRNRAHECRDVVSVGSISRR